MANRPGSVAVGARSRGLTVAESYAYSREVARTRARNFYYAFRLLPPARRDAICAVYAFMRNCDDLSDEPGATRAPLEQWRGELREALAGGDPLSHPVWPALVDTAQRFQIPHHIFEDMIDGVESDLEPRRFESFDELYRYCYQVASTAGLATIYIFGFDNVQAPALAERCGVAFQLTNILRDIREDADRGRLYLPEEDLRRFHVSTVEDSPAFRELLRFEGGRARRLYEESTPLVGMIERASRPSMRALIDIYSELLHRIEKSGYDVLARRISVPAWLKLWLMWRARF